MGRIVRYTLAAMLGAVAAWAVMEPTPLMPNDETVASYAFIFVIGLVSGLCIGVGLGVAEAVSGLSPRDGARSILMGALIGAGGGVLGLTFGNTLYNVFYTPDVRPNLVTFVLLLTGRGFGWALIGMFIGLSQGLAAGSTKKMRNGAVGGFVGGLAGGCVFEVMVWLNRGGVTNYPPPFIRFVSFAMTGCGIGLLIGVIEEVAKRAWLIRLVGKNEGKEHSLYKPVTVIGRSEFADIPVFSDPDVVERHAAIIAHGGRYFVEDTGSFMGTRLNGDRITQRQDLRDGDVIEVGKTRFLFRDKATRRADTAADSRSEVAIPSSERICPFCGGVRDANGICDCSIVGGGAPGQESDTRILTVQQTQHSATDMMPPEPAPTADGLPGAARLLGIDGPYSGTIFELDGTQIEIGRDSAKDIPLPLDNTVSRTHARIAAEAGGFVLYDAGSTNGTHVNGARVQRHELRPGDVIQIGGTSFRFEA